MSEEKPKRKKKVTTVTAQAGLGIKLKLEKSNKFGGQRLRVTVSLTQDGKEIATDSDFITLE